MRRWNDDDVRAVFKPVDSAWTVVLVDPLLRPVVASLARVGALTPVRLTVVAHLGGLLAAAALANGWLVAGALLFEARFFVDCLDGKVARLRSETSEMGALLDVHGDRVVVTLTFVGLAAHLGEPWLAVAVTATYLLYFELQQVRNSVYHDARLHRTVDRLGERGVGAALRRRRIYPNLTSVDVEHLVLFVAPLGMAAGADVGVVALTGASLFFGANALRFGVAALRAANGLDAGTSRPPDDVRW